MPRSRSSSIESSICGLWLRLSTAPVTSRMRSARVDFPWSMWAMIEKFRMFRAGAATPRPLWSGGLHLRHRVAGIVRRRSQNVGPAVVADRVEPSLCVESATQVAGRGDHPLLAVERPGDYLSPLGVDDHGAAVSEYLLVGERHREVVR